jgi:hypothetical protein
MSLACGQKDACHHKEASKESCGKKCCKEEDKDTSPCGKGHKDCDGKCGHSSCNCPSAASAGFAIIPTEEYKYEFLGFSYENVLFGYTETFFKSAIDSLRLPPKIS